MFECKFNVKVHTSECFMTTKYFVQSYYLLNFNTL